MFFEIQDSGTISVSNVNVYMPEDSFYDKFELLSKQFPMMKFEWEGSKKDNMLYITFDDIDEDFAEEIQSWMNEHLNKDC